MADNHRGDGIVVKDAEPQPVRPFSRLVSLGRNCQTAFQIRRVTAQREQTYFDWVETPHLGLVSTLRCGLDLPFQQKNLSLTEDRQGVFDQRTGFTHRYLFTKRAGEDTLELQQVMYEYGRQKAVLGLLARMWRESISSERVLFVRQDEPTPKQALDLFDALAPYTSGQGFALLYVTAPGNAFSSPREGIFVEAGPPLPDSETAWSGDDAAWDSVLRKFWQTDHA